MEVKRNIAVPRYAEYNCAIRYLIEQGFQANYIKQPPLTKRSAEIGAKYSPDFVCTPFKTTLGSMIESLEAGADTIIMSYGVCRLGYYGELQEQILRDLGYEFDFINLEEYSTGKKRDYLKVLRRVNPKLNVAKLSVAAVEAIKMVEHVDEVTGEYYKNEGFDPTGAYKKAYKRFLSAMYTANSKADIQRGYETVKETFASIPLEKPKNPLRVGIIGEFYTAMDAFSNLEVEQKLADMQVEVHRWMTVSNRTLHYSGEKNLHVKIKDLCDYEMGPTSTANIWCAREYAEQGFDGLIHIKSANCTPEIDIMPVLQNISTEYKIPILYLTFDSQTSDVGLMTRLEAFYDMIQMRKRNV
jgi:hypothetical protein